MTGVLSSMTGYARAGGRVADVAFLVEVKSVNARGLDMRMRLASGFDSLEVEVRRRIASVL